MADSNEQRFHQGIDRVLGGLPNKPARVNTRVADDKDIADLRALLPDMKAMWDRVFGALPQAPHRGLAKGAEPRRLADDKDIADLRADIAALRKLIEGQK